MQAKLFTNEHGYDDFDITGIPNVHRACVPSGIKRGHRFNVYCDDGAKLGVTWEGSLECSMSNMVATHPAYRVA